MSISTKNIHDYINACQTNTNDSLTNTQLTGAICALEKGSVYSVPTLSDLPTASENEGRMIFVEDVGGYRYSDGVSWTNDYDSNFQIISSAIYRVGVLDYTDIGSGSCAINNQFVQFSTPATNWTTISNGCAHVSLLNTSGELWSWGKNNLGQLGDGSQIDSTSPIQEITSSINWCQASSSGSTTKSIKTSGTLWGWGLNSFGQLGAYSPSSSSPVQEISSSTDWCMVSTGSFHALATKTSGELWSSGYNASGQLGDGTTSFTRSSPVQEISSSSDWCQVSTGDFHSSAIKTSGELWSWGRNDIGQIGDGTTICRSSPVQEISSSSEWLQVSSGYGSAKSALKTNGTLWGWGCNTSGNIGDGTTICRSSPVQEITSSTDWCQASNGFRYVSAIKTSGELWAWGCNSSRGLGDGTTIDRSSPVQEFTSSTDWSETSSGVSATVAIKIDSKGFI